MDNKEIFWRKNVEAKGHSKGGICRKHRKNHMILLYFKKSKKQKKIKKCIKILPKNDKKTEVEKRKGSRTKFHRYWVDLG